MEFSEASLRDMSETQQQMDGPESAQFTTPNFDIDAVRTLTEKIQGGLKTQSTGSVLGKSSAKLKSSNGSTKSKSGGKKSRAPLSNPSSNGKTTAVKKAEHTVTSKQTQGKKRSRDGNFKDDTYSNNNADVNSIKLGRRAPKSTANENSKIEDEIRALGGTEEDLDLIQNALSESEMEGEDPQESKPLGSSLNKETLQLVRQLGVDNMGRAYMLAESESEMERVVSQLDVSELDGKTMRSLNGIKPATIASRPIGKSQRVLFFQPQNGWHAAVLPPLTSQVREVNIIPPELMKAIHDYAKILLDYENKRYGATDTSASSAHQFYSTIMSTGTLSDKISALTLSVQESPVHNMKALESLIGLARKRSRGQAVEVLGALKDLFGAGNLLPSDRKLRTFSSQPALNNVFDPTNFQWTPEDPLPKDLKEIHLISWAYEDWLKSMYFEILKIMETWCNDEVVFARGKAVDYVCQLLKEKPEQEANLLRLLVNKLGDSDRKIASKTSFHILQLETTHPLMKPTIIAAIESDLLFRPGQSLHAKYYATITLNQTVLSGKEESVARKLLDIYFNLFIQILESPEIGNAAATVVNGITINKKGEVQGGGGPGGKKAQKRLAEKAKATTVDEDLREKMLSAVLTGINRAIPFTNAKDESFDKHLDILFRVTHSSNFNTSIQALMLVQQLTGSHQSSIDRFYRTLYESLLDPRLLTSSKQALYLNLLFRALRSDLAVKRVKAFAKRLLQVVAQHQPSFACGALYLLRELEDVFAGLGTFISQAEEESEGEEEFRDVQENAVDGRARDAEAALKKKDRPSTKYDGRKRDPEHSNAAKASLWELTPFLHHYHPSVSLFATRLLARDTMPPKPDLSLNTLIHFLDRFVYRNPKATTTTRGASIMQPVASVDSAALLVSAHSNKSSGKQPVNTEAFWKQDSGKIHVDEVFFHRYFSTLGKGKEKARKRKTESTANAEHSEDEVDEGEIWKALVESRPEMDEGSDSGFGDNDLESDTDNFGEVENGTGSELEEEDESPASDRGEAVEDLLDLEDEDDEALLDSDDEVPDGLDEAFANEDVSSKREHVATPQKEKRSNKRRRLKNLPTFASAEDYAKMLEDE